jgi:hypothetical protein
MEEIVKGIEAVILVTMFHVYQAGFIIKPGAEAEIPVNQGLRSLLIELPFRFLLPSETPFLLGEKI